MRVRVILIVFFLLVILAGGIFAFFYYRSHSLPQGEMAPTFEIPDWYVTDKDGDLISDEEENRLGTNPKETDTDGDTVPDKLEIEKYKTSPIKPDTDDDGEWDGAELLLGHDPLVKNAVSE